MHVLSLYNLLYIVVGKPQQEAERESRKGSSVLFVIIEWSDCFLYMPSIHNNLSAGAQNVTGAYVIIIMLVIVTGSC